VNDNIVANYGFRVNRGKSRRNMRFFELKSDRDVAYKSAEYSVSKDQLRIMAKQQSGLIKPDSVYQNKSGEISQKTDDSLIEANNNDTLLEKADDQLK
jgi:hypothetical protein